VIVVQPRNFERIVYECEGDLFEATHKEIGKWVNVRSSKYKTISVIRERHSGRL